ncbi:MAG: Oxidoreductase family, NAD-binding Rossmann fold [Paenibacillus sp.]|jgi:predicted dehydrogenase|nr:Oxidoreductase family, NAD-binding Rossmann fold [Paenibacillus sp.]
MGIIGCGGMAAAHFSGYKELGDHTEVTVVCDIELERAQSAASLLGISTAVTDYRELG